MTTKTIDWAAVEHAYGPATDVPLLLAKIGAGKAAAVDTLANRIAHQGWASPAAARAVVGELPALLDNTKGATRAKLLVLLADLACAGSHEHFLGTKLDATAPAMGLLDAPDLARCGPRRSRPAPTPRPGSAIAAPPCAGPSRSTSPSRAGVPRRSRRGSPRSATPKRASISSSRSGG